MHKTFLNEIELQIIKDANKIVNKIGGFPSMENGTLERICITNFKDNNHFDVEFIFDISGWLKTVDFYLAKGINKTYYQHKNFSERKIKILFHNCCGYENTLSEPIANIGEIKFGGKDQLNPKNRHQDSVPGVDAIIERPYVCFYIRNSTPIVYFDENECEISTKLY